MAEDLADENLSGKAYDLDSEVTVRLIAAANECLAEYPLDSEEAAGAFFEAKVSYMLAEELRRRLEEVGYEMAPLESLAREYAVQPDLDISEYIDARPAQFREPISLAAQRSGISENLIIRMQAGYIRVRSRQWMEEERLAAIQTRDEP